MRRVLDVWESILVTLMTGMLAVFTIVVAYQVFSRYVEFVPRFFWTEEISRFSFIWMLFLGAAVAVRRKTHFVIDILPRALHERHGRHIDVFVFLVVLVVAISMVVGGYYFVQMGMKRISTAAGIHLAWIYLAIPVSGISMVVFAFERLLASYRGQQPRDVP